ncbi:MAG: hypothetical protein JNM42_03995 [Propionivibrio sp.]|uniref:hypothetical protein n=1 Tax=Propionivibrio sp. TaxID=2212460 RepID=UPI001A4106FD|nr:hypothetical protein [Propionivibrio sp.]MBL8413582.1 hypothetical protein [Propionivibrio sp.]
MTSTPQKLPMKKWMRSSSIHFFERNQDALSAPGFVSLSSAMIVKIMASGFEVITPCGHPANAASLSEKRGTPVSQLMARGGCRRQRHWQSRYHCASSSTGDYRTLHHRGRNSIHRTAGYETPTSGGVEGRAMRLLPVLIIATHGQPKIPAKFETSSRRFQLDQRT